MEEEFSQIPEISPQRGFKLKWNYQTALFSIILLTIICYLTIWKNGFVNWDDDAYIYENHQLFSFRIKEFLTQQVLGNYHPITMIVLAIEFKLFGLNPAVFHGLNLLLHLSNIILVFYCIRKLSNKTDVALIAALLFGIHPVHVESVAWAAELKDVLYTFFFLWSYLFYMKYTETGTKKHYLLAIILFLTSLLSKGMAVTLPLVLVLTDYYKRRGLNRKTILDKVPFFALSLLFGIIALAAQKSANAMPDLPIDTLGRRAVYAGYSFVMYLYQLVLPVNLCIFYPYPESVEGRIQFSYYLYLIPLAALIVFSFYSLRFTRKIIFAVGFFTFTIIHVLKLVPVGDALMADRYNYVPSIGIFFLAGEFLSWLLQKDKRWLAIPLLLIFTVFFSIQTFARVKVWNNSMALWNDVINRYQNVEWAYNNRGIIYLNEKKFRQALEDFNKAIALNSNFPGAFNNRGVVYMDQKMDDLAIKDFEKAIQLDITYFKAYNNLGDIYREKDYDKSLENYSKAIALNPDFFQVHVNRGNLFIEHKKYPEAIEDYTQAISLNPYNPSAYFSRGDAYKKIKKYDLAEADFDKIIHLFPSDINGYNSRGSLYLDEKKYDLALKDFDKAISIDTGFADAYYNRGNLERLRGDTIHAIADYTTAIKLTPWYIRAFNNRGTLYMNQQKFDSAIADYKVAMKLNTSKVYIEKNERDTITEEERVDSADLYENYARTFDMRGTFYTNQRKYDQALEDYNEAIRLKPNFAQAYYNRGVVHDQKADYMSSLADYSAAIKIRPVFPEAIYNRGVAEFHLQKKQDACRDFKRAAELGYQKAKETVTQFCN